MGQTAQHEPVDVVTEKAVTTDTVYQGRVQLIQPKSGFRAGTDSLLLAAGLGLGDGAQALELGCGCGGALLPAAYRLASACFHAIDIDPEMTQLAMRGARANGFQDRVTVETGQATDWVRAHENRFDLVFSNPPFFVDGTIAAPAENRRKAYIETVSLEAWMKAMVFAAKPKAPIVLLHRAGELARILAGLDKWTGEITILPVRPQMGREANRILVRGRKGLRKGRVRLLSGLDLRDDAGAPTPALEAIWRGEPLVWG